jgi:ferrous iron transport protein B
MLARTFQKVESVMFLRDVIRLPQQRKKGFAERLSEAMMNPLTGLPILALALFVLYMFVGVLGAQTLVGFLEGTLFGGLINPWVDRLLQALIPCLLSPAMSFARALRLRVMMKKI